MPNKYGAYDDEEEDVLAPKEPQVTSQNSEERKAARTLRIKKRKDALKKADQPPEEVLAEEEPDLIEQATANAAEELQRLSLDGAAKVTNVKVTTDEREVIRRTNFAHKMQKSMDLIEAEATEAQLQYEAISSNWEAMLKLKDPLDIDAAIKEQKDKCDSLLAQKNEVVQHVKNDLKRMDEDYYEDLEKQDNDIKELSDRIEKQVTLMQRAYEAQLALISQAITIERDAMIDHNNKRWEALYKQRDKEEISYMDYKFEQLEEHKNEIEAIMWEHHEKYREAKIQLETLIQELQKELEKLKATCIINTEKIGYNYQVLKKREEENIFVRSQQKRKLNKMSDLANSLRAKIRKAAEDGAAEEMKADAEIIKLMQAMDDLEKKCAHFAHVNNYKFTQVWRMSVARCIALSRSVRQAEVALHAQLLAEPAPPPPHPPPRSPLSFHDSQEVAKQSQNSLCIQEDIDPGNAYAKEAKENLVRYILQMVADNTGFLVEDRLLRLIEKYQPTARNLCTLDSIFMALEIQAEEDIELLCKTFLNYAFCPTCIEVDLTPENAEPFSAEAEIPEDAHSRSSPSISAGKIAKGDRAFVRPHMSIGKSLSISTSHHTHVFSRGQELAAADQLLMAEAEEIIQRCGDPQDVMLTGGMSDSSPGASQSTRRSPGARGVTVSSQPADTSLKVINPFLCPMGHRLEIEPVQVLTALGEFITIFIPPDKRKLYDILDGVKPPEFTTPSRRLSAEEIDKYWTQWTNIFPPDKDRFWDGLLVGLNNYLKILQERERLHDEVVELRRRNATLRRLVRGALPELPAEHPSCNRPYTNANTLETSPQAPYKLPPI